MGEYLAQDIRKEFNIDILIGAKDDDFSSIINPTTQSGWGMFKMMWKGPEKALICMGMSDGMKAMKDAEEYAK